MGRSKSKEELKNELSEVKTILHIEQSTAYFLERLLEARHGKGWENLTIAEAKKYYIKESSIK